MFNLRGCDIKKTLKPATNELATMEFSFKTFNTMHMNLEKPATKILLTLT